MKTKLLLIFLFFVSSYADAQCDYIPSTSTKTDTLSYVFSGGIFASYGCAPIDPTYWVAGNGPTITINFVNPQCYPAFRVWGMNDDDTAIVSVNGVSYPLTSLSAQYNAKVVCGLSPGPNGVIFANGKLVGANSNSTGNYSYQDVQLNTTNVSSIKITSISGAGWGFAGTTVNCYGVSAGSNATICPGDNATLTGTGNGTYVWNPGGQTTSSIVVSPTVNTTYTFSATNACGTNDATVSVIISNSISASITGNTSVCSGQSTTLTASGGSSFSWSTGQTSTSIIVSPTSNTTYSVIASNGNCAGTASVAIAINPSPIANAGNNVTICPGDNVTLSGTGNGTYAWNPGGQTTSSIVVSPTTNSTYTFSVTNSCGTKDTTVSITISNSIVASITGNTNLCSGQSTTLTASGGSSFLWSTGQSSAVIIVSPTSNSTYSVTVHSGSCADSISIVINVAQTPTAFGSNFTICSGTTATLSGGLGGNYSWSTGQTTSSIIVAPATSTNYSVIVSNGICTDTGYHSATVISIPVSNIAGGTTICTGQTVTLTASGGGNYSWNNGATATSIIVMPTSSSTYSVVTTVWFCKDTASATVVVSPPPTASVSNATICSGQGTILTASGGGNYSWSNGATTSSIIVSPSSSSNYSVVVSIGNCSDSANAMVTVNPNPIATASSNTTISQGQSATLTAGGGGTYSWSNGSNNSSIVVSPLITMPYCVVVTSNNCSDTNCVTVTVEPSDCSASATGELYFPNAFSPNDDGEDETFGLYFIRYDCIKTFLLRIYNRWGEKIFETEDPKEKWDGIYKGKKEESAVFAYYLKYELVNGMKAERKGNVSLMK